MDYLQKLNQQVRLVLLVTILVDNVALLGLYALALNYHLPNAITVAVLFGGGLALMVLMTLLLSWVITQPLRAIRQHVLSVSPAEHEVIVPTATALWLGRDLVTNLTHQIYQLANSVETAAKQTDNTPVDFSRNVIAATLPLPLFVIDQTGMIIFANDAALKYLAAPAGDVIDKDMYSVLDMAFPSEETLDSWLANVQLHSVTANKTWERVRLNNHQIDGTVHQFDLAAHYNKDNPDHAETLLVLFDRSKSYGQDDLAVNFMAMAVHELRTPLTLLRGYIEVFEEDLEGNISSELENYLKKMHATAQRLTGFVNTILNVARVEADQLELKLQKEQWDAIVHGTVDDLTLRAQVHGITLECNVDDGLPAVGADRTAIYEVIANLIDNAIKYSGSGKQIVVHAGLNNDGLVETSVQDFGVGIPSGVMPDLFNKFSRNHRNRSQIGGTGLGLYLSKAIVGAHGGNIWIQSKVDQGTTVSFTVQPFDKLAGSGMATASPEIVRGAHGWIKNHSLYRR